ncbi:bZIP transcription factor 44-like [Typha angustifolia]|uniref:bZIP transcription factor 44-like n=1 Tax=Typha angustifolia TaxID=59011 RepID=UPI003C2F317E
MASPSGTCSGSNQFQNSGSEEELQALMDEKRKKRKQSNRESAKRSRMRKQKQVDDLMFQVSQLRKDNTQLLTALSVTTQSHMAVEADNSVLRTQMMELSNRLQSLNEIIHRMNYANNNNFIINTNASIYDGPHENTFINPWNNSMFVNQPIMASADIYLY